MLVLSRRIGESIVIGDRVWIRVAQVRGKRVRLAIVAPESVRVHREEIQRKRQEFQAVKQTTAQDVDDPI